MRGPMVILALAAAALAAAAWQQAVPELWINGAKADGAILIQGGEPYIPLRALRAAGADVTATEERVTVQFQPAKPAAPAETVVGGIRQYVSNGQWAVRVQDVRDATNPHFGRGKGFGVTLELRNLRDQAISPSASGMQIQLLDANGKVLSFGSRSFTNLNTRIAPADAVTNTLVFGDATSAMSEIGDADRLTISFRGTGANRPKAIRIDLR
ncbi:MAG: hypothetical protein ACO1SV_22825 [Fimbriimonas sp.]